MYSQEEMFKFAKEYLAPKLELDRKFLREELNQNGKKIKEDLLACTDNLFHQCIRQQKEKLKQPIRYVHFFYLNLSVLTGCYDIQMNAFSEQSYMDKTESVGFWNPSFVMNLYKKDMDEMEKEAKRQVVRFGYPQMMELKERSFIFYVMLAGEYLQGMTEDIIALPSFHEMEKKQGLQIVFGGYMDVGIQIWPKAVQEEKQ